MAAFIGEAVQSVLNQTYQHWELIVIENGSKDETLQVLSNYNDPRIKVFQADKVGLSNARNIGLKTALGEFICFLDADDKLPEGSIEARVSHFIRFPDITFLDGRVITYNNDLTEVLRDWIPDFRGMPEVEMALLAPRCFAGITWMIRVKPQMKLEFDESWTHLEDRVFFLNIAKYGKYDFLDECIYIIRRRSGSLMADHAALEQAYVRFMNHVKALNLLPQAVYIEEQKKFHSIFFKTYLKQLSVFKAIRHFYKRILLSF